MLGSRDSMRQHILAYHNQKYYQCPICAKKFKQKAEKIEHLAKHHDLEEITVNRRKVLQKCKRYICDLCQKEMPSRAHLVRHIRLHKMAVCPECSVSFKSTQLARHRSDVHGVPISTCGICGYKNSSRRRVATHQQRVHLKEKHIACSQCNDMFFDMRGLRNHLVKHNPEKIYTCSFCKKKFPRLSALRAHEKIHTGEKKKVCPVCDERFVQKASLNYHMTKRHPSVPY